MDCAPLRSKLRHSGPLFVFELFTRGLSEIQMNRLTQQYEIAAYMAAGMFNKGYSAIFSIMKIGQRYNTSFTNKSAG